MAFIEPYISSSALGKLNLSGTQVQFSHKNNLSPPSFPGKITSGDVVGSVDFMGWENSTIRIEGIFDEKQTAKVDKLKSFARSTTGVSFYDPILSTSSAQVVIDSLTMTRAVDDGIYQNGGDTTKGPIVRYTIDLVLTE